MIPEWLKVSEEVAEALHAGRPIVALESTLITHGLPWPTNLETAQKAEASIRAEGAIPATIAVREGCPTVGLTEPQLAELAESKGIMKASRRDLGAAVALRRTAGTTVSATMVLAHAAGIRVFATGGIGGAHKESDPTRPLDISWICHKPWNYWKPSGSPCSASAPTFCRRFMFGAELARSPAGSIPRARRQKSSPPTLPWEGKERSWLSHWNRKSPFPRMSLNRRSSKRNRKRPPPGSAGQNRRRFCSPAMPI